MIRIALALILAVVALTLALTFGFWTHNYTPAPVTIGGGVCTGECMLYV